MDWLHRYGGEWEGLIIVKMVLAALLCAALIVVMLKDDCENRKFDWITGLYFLLILMAVGLGYSGGDLVFG
jgi:heme A synthase